MALIIDYENKLIYVGDGYEVVQYEEEDATFFDDEGNEYWYDEAEDITYIYDEFEHGIKHSLISPRLAMTYLIIMNQSFFM